MRMPADHLCVYTFRDIFDGELATFLRYLRVENNLKEQVAQLVTQLIWPAFECFFNCLKGFVGFFQKHWSERCIRLLAVPGATLRRTQLRHQSNQVSECSRHVE